MASDITSQSKPAPRTHDERPDPTVLVERMRLVQEVVTNLFVLGTHYDYIGKADREDAKPCLLQPGAQALCTLFRLSPAFDCRREWIRADDGAMHVEYDVTCRLSKPDGSPAAEGVGYCTTLESRYRWRNQALSQPIPDDYRERKSEYAAEGYGARKISGNWCWCKLKAPNPDVADRYNTAKKMACKRALVHAAINALGISYMVSQDLEDLPEFRTAPPPPDAQLAPPIPQEINQPQAPPAPADPPAEPAGPPKRKSFGKRGVQWLQGLASENNLDYSDLIAHIRMLHPDLPADVAAWPYAMKEPCQEAVASAFRPQE